MWLWSGGCVSDSGSVWWSWCFDDSGVRWRWCFGGRVVVALGRRVCGGRVVFVELDGGGVWCRERDRVPREREREIGFLRVRDS